jgi:hypothetical protein
MKRRRFDFQKKTKRNDVISIQSVGLVRLIKSWLSSVDRLKISYTGYRTESTFEIKISIDY